MKGAMRGKGRILVKRSDMHAAIAHGYHEQRAHAICGFTEFSAATAYDFARTAECMYESRVCT